MLAANEAGSLTLTSGQSAVAEAGKAPVLRIVARPRMPCNGPCTTRPSSICARMNFQPDRTGKAWCDNLSSFTCGELQKAFDSIANVRRISATRAFLPIALTCCWPGRVDEAGADIERALRLHPNDSNALALQTIIAVVQNDKDTALQVAQQAVGTAPDSATAQIALSYAQQARFDLEARAPVWKRRSNWIRKMRWRGHVGRDPVVIRRTEESAQSGTEGGCPGARSRQDPDRAGFRLPDTGQDEQAKEAFAKAIALDQADPSEAGSGLAKIREGSLDEGSRDIEVAASLDPNNALIRSYLGKAYYEEKRTGLDEREYAVAKELDPKDPTPGSTMPLPSRPRTDRWRPCGPPTRHRLNDNRAVYRSRLLLDADLGTQRQPWPDLQ